MTREATPECNAGTVSRPSSRSCAWRFNAAAERLRVSSSHVSRLVSQLENQLDTPLLYRTTRRIRLTEAGRLYYQHCHHLFDGFREAEAAVKELQTRPSGLLGLTCATTFGERYLAPLVHDFMRLHPQLEVRMHFTNRRVDIIDEASTSPSAWARSRTHR